MGTLPLCTGLEGQQALRFRHLNLAEGLSQSSALTMVQDHLGMVWIGTQNGLNRLDGGSVRSYRLAQHDPASLTGEYIRDLLVDRDGRLWIATRAGGIFRYDSNQDQFVSYPAALSADPDTDGLLPQFTDLVELPDGRLVVGSSGGLFRISEELQALQPVDLRAPDEESHPAVGTLAVGDRGDVWVGATDGTLAVARPGVPGDPWVVDSQWELGADIRVIRRIASDTMVVGTDGNGLFLATLEDGQWVPRSAAREAQWTAADNRVRDVLHDSQGGLWVATNSGVSWRPPGAQGFTHYASARDDPWSPPNNLITSLLEDRNGNVWVGTWNGVGVVSRHRSAVTRPAFDHLDLTELVAIEGDGNVLWLGGLGGRLFRWDRSTGAPPARVLMPDAAAGRDIFSLSLDASGRLWISTIGAGIWSFTPGGAPEWVPWPLSRDFTDQDVPSIFVDSQGLAWAGTRRGGLARRASEGSFERYPERATREPHILGVVQDSTGALWFGAHGPAGGVYRLDTGTGAVTGFTTAAVPGQGLNSGLILTILPVSSTAVYVGTQGGGLNVIDPSTGSARAYTTEEGLPHNTVAGLLQDDQGRIWVSTNGGLARFDPIAGTFWVLKQAAGLQDDRFYANSAYKDDDGLLYFGGPRGLNIIDPSRTGNEGTPPSVALTGFRINGHDRPEVNHYVARAGLDLEPDENFFTFEFAALDFTDVTQNRYRYRLEGLDEDWIDNGNDNVANYTSVPHGNYTFRVAARNSEGVWNQDGLEIPVRVQPHYYETLWFQSAVVLAVLSTISGLYLYRLRQLQARQQLRLDIAGKLHDDIGANLSTIALKAGMLQMASSLDEKRKAHLHDMAHLARDSAHKVRETVWVVNTRYDTLAGLISKMRDTADVILEGHVAYTFEEPTTLPDMKLKMETRQNIYLMFKETLHNVVKHASASTVQIDVQVDGNELTLSVEDDGVGFTPGDAGDGSGQALLQHRASQCRGSVQVTSRPGDGTRVEMRARLR